MQPTAKEYAKMVDKASPPSKSGYRIPTAFAVGGAICALGQLFINLYISIGMEKELASTSASVTLVFLSALLTGLRVYDNIARLAGAGTLVPITGFSNAVASPALEFKSEGMVLGVGAKMFIIAGPVIVYGVVASVIYGVILYAFGLY